MTEAETCHRWNGRRNQDARDGPHLGAQRPGLCSYVPQR